MLVKVLDSQLSNMIAAGEVVERPSSAAKELCENAIDAGATSVTVEISGGGLRELSVTDNGCGLHPDDMETAFLRHATSKISTPDDLAAIMTLGFRGEALASIGAVSRVTMTSRMEGFDGRQVVVEGGKVIFNETTGCPIGTRISVKNLFYNTPARMKFLKKDYTEAGYVEEVVRKLSLAHPEISFRFVSDGKEKLFTPGDGNLKNTVYSIYGKDISSACVPLSYSEAGVKISGLAGNITLYRKNRALQSFYVNNRPIVSRTLTAALEEGFKGMIPIGCFPVAVLKVEVDPASVDVNVHPAKLEVKFANENQIYSAVYWAVKNALMQKLSPVVDAEPEASEEIKIPATKVPSAQGFNGAFSSVAENKTSVGKPQESFEKDTEELKKQQKPDANAIRKSIIAEFSDKKPEEEKNETPAKIEEAPVPSLGARKKIGEIEYVQSASFVSGESFSIIGQLFNTYILIEEGNGLVLVDQHAAHERLIYERLVKEKQERKILPQMLLVPEIVSLTPTEFATVQENKSFFENLGWELDEFGDNDIAVRGVPYVITKEQVKDTLVEIIGNLQTGKQRSETEKEERILYTIACRSAVKGHDKLTLTEMESLVKSVRESERTLTCPHGRPVSTTVTKAFIEKLFKRL